MKVTLSKGIPIIFNTIDNTRTRFNDSIRTAPLEFHNWFIIYFMSLHVDRLSQSAS